MGDTGGGGHDRLKSLGTFFLNRSKPPPCQQNNYDMESKYDVVASGPTSAGFLGHFCRAGRGGGWVNCEALCA